MSGSHDSTSAGIAAGVIDSHCHLDRFASDEHPALLERARAAGLAGMVTIGTRLSEASVQQGLTALDAPDLRVWCTIGTHPDHVDEEIVPEPEALAEHTLERGIIGIGESGLDYFHGKPEIRELQQESFRAHIRAARLADVPLVIHARDADEDIARILAEEISDGGAFAFLLHCFSSGPELARRALELGGFISFSGIATFRNSEAVREIAATVPKQRLLVETDAPFLAPAPFRGKRNEPSYVVHTAHVLAEIHGLTDAGLAALTTDNFYRLFKRASA